MTNEELRQSEPAEFWQYMYKDKPLQTRSGGTIVKIITEEMKYKRKGRGKNRKIF